MKSIQEVLDYFVVYINIKMTDKELEEWEKEAEEADKDIIYIIKCIVIIGSITLTLYLLS